jgi:hypothetical protein
MKTFFEWLSKLAENDPQAASAMNQFQTMRQQAFQGTPWEPQAQANLTQTDQTPGGVGAGAGGPASKLYNPITRIPTRTLGQPVNRLRTSPQPGQPGVGQQPGQPPAFGQPAAPSYMKKR